jgi:Flp pilus assembly secretin CpaC/tetratricopeptide (TPR) repeat protein
MSHRIWIGLLSIAVIAASAGCMGSGGDTAPAKKAEAAPASGGAAPATTGQTGAGETPAAGDANKTALEKAAERLKEISGTQPVDPERASRADLLYQEGLALFKNWEYEEALKKFEEALAIDPNHAGAAKYVERTRVLLDKHIDKRREALKTLSGEERVKAQEALFEMENFYEQGQMHLNNARIERSKPDVAEDTRITRASAELSEALKNFERAREASHYLPYQFEVGDQQREMNSMILNVKREIAENRNDLQQYTDERGKRAAEEAFDRERGFEERKKQALVAKAELLYNQGRYEQCESLAGKILEQYPGDLQALRLKSLSRNHKHEVREVTAYRESQDNRKGVMLDVDQYSIPQSKSLIYYPDTWVSVQMRRAEKDITADITEEAWMKDIKNKLKQRVTFSFENTPLSEAITFLQRLSGITIILDQRGPDPNARITLTVKEMTMDKALEWILRGPNLQYTLKDQALFISNTAGVAGDLVLQSYQVQDLVSPLIDFPGPDINITGTPGQFLPATDVTPAGVFGAPSAPEKSSAELSKLISDTIMPGTWDQASGTSIEERNGNLMVIHRPEAHRLVQKLLADLRATQKILVYVEARFLEVYEGFFEEIGANFGGLPAAAGAIPTTTPEPAPYGLAGGLFAAGKAVPPGFSDLNNNINPWGPGTLNILGASTNNVLNPAPDSTSPTQIGSAISTGQIARQTGYNAQVLFVGNIQAQAFLHALKIRESGTTLAAPRLVMNNSQRAHMYVLQQTAYVGGVDVAGGGAGVTINQYLEGIIFDVRPIVSADRKYITMELRPTTSTLEGMATQTVNVQLNNPDQVIGGVIQPGGVQNMTAVIQEPKLQIQRIRTTVTIPDGGIILIGGLMRNVKFHAENGIPVMKDIPLLGRLFRWDVVQNERRNLLIMVTGRILLFDELERERGIDR